MMASNWEREVQRFQRNVEELKQERAEHARVVKENDELRRENAGLKAKNNWERDLEVRKLRRQVERKDCELKQERAEHVEADNQNILLRRRNLKLREKVEKFESDQDLRGQLYELKDGSAFKAQRFNEILDGLDPSNEQRDRLFEDLWGQYEAKYRNKQYDDALEFLFKALIVEQSGRKETYVLARLWNNISCCLTKLKRYEKALEAIEKAIEYDSAEASYFYNRGLAHEEMGKKAKAIDDFKKALKSKPNPQLAEDAERNLAELQRNFRRDLQLW